MARKVKRKRFLSISRRYLLMSVAGIVILGGAALAWHNTTDKPSSPSDNPAAGTSQLSPTSSGSSVNLNPPTAAQSADGQSHKDAIVQKDEQLKDGSNLNSQATVVITEATNTEVRGYISGVLEDNGTCTATATKQGRQTATATSTGFMNVSYTQCAPISWGTTLASGQWTITVSYKSSSTAASSSITKTL
jgi:hypothetical protein